MPGRPPTMFGCNHLNIAGAGTLMANRGVAATSLDRTQVSRVNLFRCSKVSGRPQPTSTG